MNRALMVLMIAFTASLSKAAFMTDLPDLNAVKNFTVFGKTVNLHNVSVYGDVGVSANGTLNLSSASSVQGDLYLDSGVKMTLGGPYGSLYQPFDLSMARSQVYEASAVIAALTPDLTYANWTSPLTINGNGGINVITVTGNVNLSSESVTLTGSPKDIFLINVLGGFTLGGSGGIIAGSGVDPSQVLVNIVGTGSKVTAKVDNEVDGTLLLPYRQMEFHSVSGAVYGGDYEIKLMSDATVVHVPFVPEPASLILFALGCVMLWPSWKKHTNTAS